VVLQVAVNAAGLAEQVSIQRSSGFEILDDAARSTVAHWRFTPARRGDQAVAATVFVPIRFKLED
jgi:protein TonB